jgi:hypothetical protein
MRLASRPASMSATRGRASDVPRMEAVCVPCHPWLQQAGSGAGRDADVPLPKAW